MSPSITGSIVIYKNPLPQLKQAVKSFLEATAESTLYLIDNSPSRDLEKNFVHPRIKYIFTNNNIGFGAGHNIALREVLQEGSSPFHLILNPDIYFSKDTIITLLGFMEQHHNVGLTMPKILYPDGRLQPLCKLLPSPLTLFSRRFLQLNRQWVGRLNYMYEMHFSGYNRIMDVPFLSGCFMFLRIDALRKVGLFDERIFLYTEDTDLTRRIHQHYRTVFNPEAVVYHYHQRESYKNLFTLMHHVFSAIQYFNKWGWFYDLERKTINQRIVLKYINE